MKYHGLGKGLGALISKKTDYNNNDESAVNYVGAKNGDAIYYIEIDKIHPNPEQPRREFNEEELKDLSESIRSHGILQPLVVSKVEKITSAGIEVAYQLIAGERRLRASRLAGLFQVPVIIRKTSPRENLELAIIENVQRSDLNAIERAVAYQKLMDEYNLSQQEMASRVGKSRESVANLMRLLNLPQEIKDAVSTGKINEGHARAMLMVRDFKAQMDLFYKVLNMGLNVREVENMAKTASGKFKKIIEIGPDIRFLVSKLEDVVGMKVSVQPKTRGGKIIIEYYELNDLENLIGKICNNINSNES